VLSSLANASLRRYHGDHDAHTHDHAQVLFGIDGCLELEVDGRAAVVDAASGLVVPPGALHSFCSRAGARVWVIDTPADTGLDRMRRFMLPLGWSPASDTAELLDMAGDAPRLLTRRRLATATLDAAVADTLHEDWPAARMAALYFLSVPRFHARWLALTGLTPQAWLRTRRLAAAEALLRAGWSLDTAALQVGYRSASALWFALRRDRGVSVKSLRKV
jgi:AraC-like DNA-binding protein